MSDPSGMPPRLTLEPLDESFERVLVVVAHPDDIEYGTAAAVDRWTTAGKTVTYLLATRGEAGIDTIAPEEAGPLRAQEERDSASEVGVDIVEFLDYDDGVVVYGTDLRRDIARVIRHRRPEVVVTLTHDEVFASGMPNQADHRAVGLAALDAARDAGNRWIFRELLKQEGLEPWGGVRAVLSSAATNPTHYLDVTGHLEPAIASLEAHHLYNTNLPDDFPTPRALITGILTGTAAGLGIPGVEHALTFRRYGL
jgi:LmbE family N-acetylglucosaminyl deacetylase